jgi:Zn-dependent peptidase ImmA (M78 family)/transcriptional regulator with XRE-family HTH domain
MPKVNPAILEWARETAGLSTAEAARKLGVPEERLAAVERGERDPTRAMLVKAAKRYRRPLLAFYLPLPPMISDKGQDFRTLPEAPPPGTEALLGALLRDIQARQGLVRAALEEAEEEEPLPFVGSAKITDGVETIVSAMRTTLGVSLEEFRQERTIANAFKLLREAAEGSGVFVLLMGNLGSHHTDIDARVFRGFALADPVAPFVVVNENDSRAAWSFTLLHELVHVWLGQTGVSGYDGDKEVERFCDAAAARFLLHPGELTQLVAESLASLEELKSAIDAFAGERKLSRKMVAYNLLHSDMIAAGRYRQLCDLFDAERSTKGRAHGGGGADYYVVRRHRVGPGLTGLVRRLLAGGELSTTEAGRVLGVKVTNVSRLLEHDRAG